MCPLCVAMIATTIAKVGSTCAGVTVGAVRVRTMIRRSREDDVDRRTNSSTSSSDVSLRSSIAPRSDTLLSLRNG